MELLATDVLEIVGFRFEIYLHLIVLVAVRPQNSPLVVLNPASKQFGITANQSYAVFGVVLNVASVEQHHFDYSTKRLHCLQRQLHFNAVVNFLLRTRSMTADQQPVALVLHQVSVLDCHKSIETLNCNAVTRVLVHNTLVNCNNCEIFDLLQNSTGLVVRRAL